MRSKRTSPLQRTHGFGVRPAACSATKSSTTPDSKSSRRSSVTCGRPSECASARALATDSGEQHERAPSPSGSAQSSSVTAITSCPASRAASAATALSTPPLMATSVRLGSAVRFGAPARAALPIAVCSASAASVAAWTLPAESPPVNELDDGAASGLRRATTVGIEAGVGDVVALDRDADRYEVAAGRAAGGASIRRLAQVAASAWGGEVVLKSLVHTPNDRSPQPAAAGYGLNLAKQDGRPPAWSTDRYRGQAP